MRMILMSAVLIAFNLGLWIVVFILGDAHFTGLAVVAWTFGLRHGLDADHICAIDNVTRRLMESNIQSVTVGFYFSIGHSIIVFIAAFLVIAAVSVTSDFQHYGGVIAMIISSSFLLLIGLLNLYIAIGLIRKLSTAKRHRTVEAPKEDEMDTGAMGKIFKPMLKVIDKPWKMLPLGFLFGLGFETATEIVVLSMSATSAADETTPIWQTIFFPLLFTAGMTLVDTADGMLMLNIYHWAFVNPIKKIFFNLVVTILSVLMALFISIIQFLMLAKNEYELEGPAWDVIEEIAENFNIVGIAITVMFILTWFISYLIYRFAGFKALEEDINANKEIV